MIAAMRTKFGPITISIIVLVIGFVFIFFGLNPSNGGMGAGGVAGDVNGQGITLTEYNRVLSQKLEQYRAIFGKIAPEQLESPQLKNAVFMELAHQKLFLQEAKEQGFGASPAQVRERILAYDAFKKDGRFDKFRYKQVLEANRMSTTHFEELISDEITDQQFRMYLGGLISVTPFEAEADLKATAEKRKIKYVYVDNEMVRKTLPKEHKPEELNAAVEKISESVLKALSANQDGQATAAAKVFGASVKTSDWLNSTSSVIPGVGSIRVVQSDMFGNSLDPKKGGQAKRYALAGGTLFAVVTASESFDASKVSVKDKQAAFQKVLSQKQNDFMNGVMATWVQNAKIEPNREVIPAVQTALPGAAKK